MNRHASPLLAALLGGPTPQEYRKDAEARATLKAQGWTDADVCMLSMATKYLNDFWAVARIAEHMASPEHGNRAAAKVALGMLDLALQLAPGVNDAYAKVGWPKIPDSAMDELRRHRVELAGRVRTLDEQAELRASLQDPPA